MFNQKVAKLKYTLFVCVKEMIMCKCIVYNVLKVAILSFQLYAVFEKQITKEEIVMTKHI